MTDEQAMRLAIGAARSGASTGHRPFGCVVYEIATGRLVATTFGTESRTDPTRHSEMLAIRDACHRERRLLQHCTLVSTHQPCPMCAGAITHAKLGRVVYGSSRADLPQLFRRKSLALSILFDTGHPPEVTGGVLREECVALFDDEVRLADEVRSPGRPSEFGVQEVLDGGVVRKMV